MAIENDGINKYIKTISTLKTPVAASWSFDPNVYVMVEAKIFCVEQATGFMKYFILKGCVQRKEEDNRIVGMPQTQVLASDVELESAGALMEVDGSTVNIRVNGVENLTLNWGVELKVTIYKV